MPIPNKIPDELPKNEIWATYFIDNFKSIFYYTLPDIWDARIMGMLNIFNLLGMTPIQSEIIKKMQKTFKKDRKFYWNHLNRLVKMGMIKTEFDINKNRKIYYVNREYILQDRPMTDEEIKETFEYWVKIAGLYYGKDDNKRFKVVLYCARCKFKNTLGYMDKATFLFFARNFMETPEYYCLNCGTYYGFFRLKLDSETYKEWRGFPFEYNRRRKDNLNYKEGNDKENSDKQDR